MSCITCSPTARCSIDDGLRYESCKHTYSVPVTSTLTLSSYTYACVFWVFLVPHFMWPKFGIHFSLLQHILHCAPNPFSLILYFWKYIVKSLREERWLRRFENRALRKIFGSKRRFVVCIPHQILFGWSKREEWDGWDMQHVWGRGELRTACWWGNLTERDHLEDPYGRKIVSWILRKWDGQAWTGLIWLRIGTVAGFCKRCNELSGSTKWGEFLDWEPVSFSGKTLLHAVSK